MQLSDLWPTDLRVIELGASSGTLAERVINSGYSRYLVVASGRQRHDGIVKRFPSLKDRITLAESNQVVRQNNADVLILGGWTALQIGRFRSVNHAFYVALKMQATPLFWLALLFGAIQCLLRRVGLPQIVCCGPTGRESRLIAFRVRRPRDNGARRFIPYTLGHEGFLLRLQSDGVRHAVLRGFETLPRLPEGQDLDVLVSDADLQTVRTLLDSGPGIQPVNLYSVTGLPGADFRKLPYFPSHVADELLDRAVVHRGLCRVPAMREHFLSLAYHALYHKGAASGLVCNPSKRSDHSRPDHDYPAELQRLADSLGLDVPITLDDLDTYLESQGWRPPHDMLVRLSRSNDWARSRLERPSSARSPNEGLAVFLLREEAMRRGGVERASRWLRAEGFQIVATSCFDPVLSKLVARNTRGGSWGAGPWSLSGGPPAAAIVVYDPVPIRPSRRRRRRQPHVANARLFCKTRLRECFNEGYPKDQHCNAVHSSDNAREAMDYLRIIMPEALDELLAGISPQLTRAA